METDTKTEKMIIQEIQIDIKFEKAKQLIISIGCIICAWIKQTLSWSRVFFDFEC